MDGVHADNKRNVKNKILKQMSILKNIGLYIIYNKV